MTGQPAWVLVVDGDASDGMTLFRLLESAGHRATVIDTGGGALELLRAEPFDLVVLDLREPGADRQAVLETMRTEEALSQTPVVVISAGDGYDRVLRSVDAVLDGRGGGGQ